MAVPLLMICAVAGVLMGIWSAGRRNPVVLVWIVLAVAAAVGAVVIYWPTP